MALEIDFDAGIQNALSAQRQITNELRAQSSELQKLERVASRLQPRLATAADIAKLGGPRFGQTPRAATQADLNRLMGLKTPGGKSLSDAFAKAKAADASVNYRKAVAEAAARGEISISGSNFGGRTGGVAAMRGITDADAQRVFNKRFDEAVKNIERRAKAGAGADRGFDPSASRAKGFFNAARSIAKGNIVAGGRGFISNVALLAGSGANAGEAILGSALAGLSSVAAPVSAGLGLVLAMVNEGRAQARYRDNLVKKQSQLFSEVDKRFEGRAGADSMKRALQNVGDFDEQRRFFKQVLPGLEQDPEVTASMTKAIFGQRVTANRASVRNWFEMMFSDGKLNAEHVEKLLEEVEGEHNRRNKPLTVKQIESDRDNRARARAWDKVAMMSKQEWNPA